MEGCNSAATQTTTVCNFDPRFPYGKRRTFVFLRDRIIISIHAPRRGSDGLSYRAGSCLYLFNPRSRVGSDTMSSRDLVEAIEFQSTPPCGERHKQPEIYKGLTQFQSTPPHGEQQFKAWRNNDQIDFNPRPRMGSDSRSRAGEHSQRRFQSTPPHGERR